MSVDRVTQVDSAAHDSKMVRLVSIEVLAIAALVGVTARSWG